MTYDAIVIGAGPAGSTSARLLAQAGWSVALVEKSRFPRRKVCGEFISATTMPVLRACGVAEVFAANAMLAAPAQGHWGRALGREHLDLMLRDAAMAAGAVLLQPAEAVELRRG